MLGLNIDLTYFIKTYNIIIWFTGTMSLVDGRFVREPRAVLLMDEEHGHGQR